FLHRFHRPPVPPLFPYTTLFRSARSTDRARGPTESRRRGDLRARRRPTCRPPIRVPTPHRVRGSRRCIAQTSERELPLRRGRTRSEEHTSELQSPYDLVCRLLLE